ncbi:uncharacterized protein LOC121368835 [Gigantopelta aegis]|uniref:uncharacterized protein LOC121368835 n=1 Tax=Gigantopelta aegis TaxID=1735272 RepID=UPI001B88AAAB|nr:uncharacterized protein LOC121368835 [Gigantopelta aegis]
MTVSNRPVVASKEVSAGGVESTSNPRLLSFRNTVSVNGVSIVGSVTMIDLKPYYRPADQVICEFRENVNISDDVETLSVRIDGNTLRIVSEELTSDGFGYNVILKNLTANEWNFYGNATMTVRDDTGAGSLVRCKVEVKFQMSSTNHTPTFEFVSDYAYTPPVNVSVNPPASNAIKIMQPIGGSVSMTFVEDGLAPKVEVITPYETESNETMITMQTIYVTGNVSRGLQEDIKIQLSDVETVLKSTLETYQRDIGTVQLPNLTRNASFADAELAVVFEARLEDYASLTNGSELKIGTGVKYGDSFIWVSDMTFVVNVPDAENRRPFLGLTLSQSKTCTRDGSILLNLLVNAKHESNSTATAYDVIINMYLLTAMTYKGLQYLPMGYSFNVNQTGNKIQIDIGRLTFSDPTVISIEEVVDMEDPRIKSTSPPYTVVAEVIYNDRWRNKTDFSTPLTHTSLNLDKKCSKKLIWTTGANCTCLFDLARSDCACCDARAQQCGPDNYNECAPLNEMWRCSPYISGFHAYSTMPGMSGDSYECDAEYKYKLRSFLVSCHRKVSGLYQDVSPLVGLLLGKDDSSQELFGISNHGRAYVMSKDAGKTWWNIPEVVYNTAKSKPTFTSAVLT